QRARAVRAAWHPALLLVHFDRRQTTVGRIDDQARLRKDAARVVESEAALSRRVALSCRTIDLLLARCQRRLIEIERWNLTGRRLRCGTASGTAATTTSGHLNVLHVVARPDTLKIRITPWRARRLVFHRLATRRGDDKCGRRGARLARHGRTNE